MEDEDKIKDGMMRKLYSLVSYLTILFVLTAGSLVVVRATPALAGPAAFTTTDPSVDNPNQDTVLCLNGNPADTTPAVNCNIYTDKSYVWLNGGPATASLGDGNYFFAVLAPGGQSDPNDGAADLLSTDNQSDRTFSVSGGVITNLGTHDFDSVNNLIRLMPYDDTTNPGGVYILAICGPFTGDGPYTGGSSTCKNDAFKVPGSACTDCGPPPSDSVTSVLSGYKYLDANHDGQREPSEIGLNGWTIHIQSLDSNGQPDGAIDTTETTATVGGQDGYWEYDDTQPIAIGTTSFLITEEMSSAQASDHWVQTGNTSDQSSVDTTDASASLDATTMSYTVTIPNWEASNVTDLLFGNVQQVHTVLSGMKYRDDDKSGAQNGTEPGLGGWTIDVLDGSTQVASATTSSDAGTLGQWSVDLGYQLPETGSTTYTVHEEQQAGWRQTGNPVFTGSPADGSVIVNSVSGAAPYTYSVTAPNDADYSATGLDFGNIPQGTICGAKYYDADTNGVRNLSPLEAGIAGWHIAQGGAANASITTGADGSFCQTVDPGTYTFTEIHPTNTAPSADSMPTTNVWFQTGNTTDQTTTSGGASSSLNLMAYSVTIPVDQPSTVSNVYFGNVCVGAGGGLTLGFWSNKNGYAIMNGSSSASQTATGTATLYFLNHLNLRNANGTLASFGSLLKFQSWLTSASATNMANMLSAQLAAMELNVRFSRVNGSALIYAPGTTSANSSGFATVNAVMAESVTELGLHGTTLSGSPYRSYQEALKNALDRGNNNLNFVQSSPRSCSITWPSS